MLSIVVSLMYTPGDIRTNFGKIDCSTYTEEAQVTQANDRYLSLYLTYLPIYIWYLPIYISYIEVQVTQANDRYLSLYINIYLYMYVCIYK